MDDDSLIAGESDGEITIAERFLPRPRMIIFGGGHIAVPLVHIASILQFDVTLFDDRPSFANCGRFPDAKNVICDNFNEISRRVDIRSSDYAIIVTRGHVHDQDCLRAILSGEIPCYMGMIGSRRRVAIVRKQLLDERIPAEVVERIHAPIGLRIGAVTPEEIAVSILAEVVQEKRKSPHGQSRSGESAGTYYADMELVEFLAGGGWDKAALITVISTDGSTPRETGAKMAVLYDGRSIGSIGGGCAESDVLRDGIDIIQRGGYRLKTIDMTDSAEDDGMVCGGRMRVLIEAI
jgi:xanthine dehydrogenase accessory factor